VTARSQEATSNRTATPAEQLDDISRAIEAAIQAPSGHNTQPWAFRVGDDAVELLADRTRALPVVDPFDRELVMSCGAALFNLRVALSHLGHAPEVELLPDPANPDVLARVRLDSACGPDREEAGLFRAIELRLTNRMPFGEQAIAPDLVGALERAVASERCWLSVCETDAQRTAVADLIAEGDRIQMADPRFRRELAAWVHPNFSSSTDGMRGYGFGFGNLMSLAGPLVIRTFDSGKRQAAKDREIAIHSPVLAVVGTAEDSPAAWLAAGQGLQRLLLLAADSGIAGSFLNQPIEVESLRPKVAPLFGRDGLPQIILRLGHPTVVPARAPRRPLRDVLIA
jgi:hypothetical protein